MIKLLDDLLIAATCNPNVPGAIVAGLRQALDEARAALPSPTIAPAATPYRVCVKDHDCEPAGSSVQIGQIVELGRGEGLRHPDCWVACDEDGWVVPGTPMPTQAPRDMPTVFDPRRNTWRPLKKSEGFGNQAGTPGAKVDLSRLEVPAQEIPTHRTCLQAHDGYVVGEVLPEGQFDRPEHWAPCDAAGWVFDFVAVPFGLTVEGHRNLWRPMRQAQFAFSTGHADAIPKSSALDEMAEQVARWAAPTREEVAKPALAVQEGGSHYKGMKIQPVEYIHANGIGYFEGNVVKYVSRWRAKGGLQDLKKARHYLDLLIELEGGEK